MATLRAQGSGRGRPGRRAACRRQPGDLLAPAVAGWRRPVQYYIRYIEDTINKKLTKYTLAFRLQQPVAY